ncbi:MAG: carbohydrate-binding protein, partial [Lachnospiraceae bacterium]|nr:carbohydrate-binding protein [Lachnospiraceae bacterium]
SDALGNAEIYVDSLDDKVGEVVLDNTGDDWNNYKTVSVELDNKIASGNHTIYIRFKTTGQPMYIANVDYFEFISADKYIKTIEGGIQIEGYQIRVGVGGDDSKAGMRTIYSVDSKIDGKDVVSSGLVYSIDELTGGKDIWVDDDNQYVYHFESTQEKGRLPYVYADSDIATSYAVTMLFINKKPLEYTVNWRVKAYAQLEDGSYVYSQTCNYTIYDVADKIYRLGGMPTLNGTNFILDNILLRVNKDYIK